MYKRFRLLVGLGIACLVISLNTFGQELGPWDVNSDGCVDIFDLTIVARSFS